MQAIKSALIAKFHVGQSLGQRMKAGMIARYDRACRAFRKSLRSNVVSPVDLNPSLQPCGWIVPDSNTADYTNYEIYNGHNYLSKGDTWVLRRSSDGIDPVAKVELSNGQLTIHHGTTQKQYFHGDQLRIDDHRFTVKLFSTYDFKKFLMTSVLALAFIVQCADIAIGQTVAHAIKPAEAMFGEPMSLSFILKGVEQINIEDLSAKISVQKVDYPANIESISVPASQNVFLVDTSSLCITRKMENLINAELRMLLTSFAPTSVVSIVEFSRRSDLADMRELYRRTFDRQLAKDVLKSKQLVHCQADGRSVNALDAVTAQKDLFSAEKNQYSHRRLFIISSGNVMPNPEAKQIIQDSKFEIYPIVYSPVSLSYVEQSFADLPSPSQSYEFKWWTKPESIAISKSLFYQYHVQLTDQIPKTAQSDRPYVVEISLKKADQNVQIFGRVDLRVDQNRKKRERIYWAVGLTILSLLLVYLFWRVILYYRTPICPLTGKVLSRTWNRSLHHLERPSAVLYIEDEDGYRKTHVLDKSRIHLGSNYGSDVYLPRSLIPHGLTVSCHKDVIFTVRSTEKRDLVRINGRDCKGSVNLSHMDVIELGHSRIYFLVAA